jgi:hypothetical protein
MMKEPKQSLDLRVTKNQTKVESRNRTENLDKFCHRLFYLTEQFLADLHRWNKKIVIGAAS